MKKYLPILIILLLAAPLIAEEIATEETISTDENSHSIIICSLSSSVLFCFPVILIGGSILKREGFKRMIRRQKTTPQERRLILCCYIELVFAQLIAGTISWIFIHWQNPFFPVAIGFHIFLMILIYETMAILINIRFFGSKGIYHEVLADSWKKLKAEFR